MSFFMEGNNHSTYKIYSRSDNMNYYNEIKQELINNEITKRVKDYSKNKSDLTTYYNVGKMLAEAGKHYGEGIIKEYSRRLTQELGKGYSSRNLWLMLKFFELKEKVQTLSAQLSWSHYCELLPIKNINKIKYYIKQTENYNLSIRQLRQRIKNKEYERIDAETKNKINNNETTSIIENIKNPLLINNKNNYNLISEKVLQKIILEDITSFMKELGPGYSFIGNEYKIKIGDNYNYIDILLFNYLYNCFVVIELKITELKKEHIGQIQIYMNYIDNNLRTINQDKTIGIIICKKDNKYIIEYCSDSRIISREYKLTTPNQNFINFQ